MELVTVLGSYMPNGGQGVGMRYSIRGLMSLSCWGWTWDHPRADNPNVQALSIVYIEDLLRFDCGICYNKLFVYSFWTTQQDALKQFLKVSTELLNIYVILQKYIKSQNTWHAALKQPKPTIVTLESVNIVSWVRCHVNFVLKVSKYLMCTST